MLLLLMLGIALLVQRRSSRSHAHAGHYRGMQYQYFLQEFRDGEHRGLPAESGRSECGLYKCDGRVESGVGVCMYEWNVRARLMKSGGMTWR